MASNTPLTWTERSVLRSDREQPYLCIQDIVVFVRDLDVSKGFYTQQLGLELLTEQRLPTGERGEEFGERYLIESLRQHRELSCQALLGTIVDGVRQFSAQEQHDDITAIVAKFRAI